MLKDAPVKCSNCKPLLAHVTETQVSICKYFWSSYVPTHQVEQSTTKTVNFLLITLAEDNVVHGRSCFI